MSRFSGVWALFCVGALASCGTASPDRPTASAGEGNGGAGVGGSSGAPGTGSRSGTGGISSDAGGGGAGGSGASTSLAHPCVAAGSCPTGTWVDISPAGVTYAYVPLSNYGFNSIAGAMPDQPLTLYVGTNADQGLWKTTDGGESWKKASTGVNGSKIDGRQWALAVDFANSNVVYTTSGYGSAQGIWKST